MDKKIPAEEALALLQRLLGEPAGHETINGRRVAMTVRQRILKTMRREAVAGNASAFTLMTTEAKHYPELDARLAGLRNPKRSRSLFPLVFGGVFEVPRGVEMDAVSAMFARGFTEEELDHLLALSLRDWEAKTARKRWAPS